MRRETAPPLTLPRPPTPPAPAANGDGLVRVTFWGRAWHALRGFFRTYYRRRTPLEAAQEQEIARLLQLVYARDVRVFQLEHELELRKSEGRIMAEEVQLWTEVHQRDRLRVEADQALYASLTAKLAPLQPEGGDGE